MFRRIAICFIVLLCCRFATYGDSNRRQSDAALLEAVAKMEAGEVDVARHILRKAVAGDPYNDALHYYCGYLAAMKNDVHDAVMHFEAAERLDSTNFWYRLRLANLYSMIEENDKAIALYEKILQKRSGDPDVMSRLADAYLVTGEYARVDSLLTRVEQIVGSNDYTTLTRVDLNCRRGTYDRIFPPLNELLSNPEISGSAKRNILRDILQDLGNRSRFRACCLRKFTSSVEICVAAHKGDTAVTHFAAEYYLVSRADSLFLALKAENPADTTILNYSLYYNFGKKNYKGAIEDCRALLETPGLTRPQMSRLHTNIADCYRQMELVDDAVAEYKRALALDRHNVMAANNYAYYMACLDRNLAKSAELSRQAITAEPENPVYLDTYAWIMYKQKKYSEAKKYMKKAILCGGKQHAEILEHYATILDMLGESSLAEGYRQQAIIKRQNED